MISSSKKRVFLIVFEREGNDIAINETLRR